MKASGISTNTEREKLKEVIDKNEVIVMKKKNQDDQFKDLYHFYKTSGEAKKIMVRNFPDLLPEFEKLIVDKLDEKKKSERKKEIVEKETEIDHCICDYDIDCKYCEDQLKDENYLYADAINTGTERT